jgi:hypothetical protein
LRRQIIESRRSRLAMLVAAVVVTVGLIAAAGAATGTFRFSKSQEYPAGPSPIDLAAGDFNGDKIIDLAVSDFANGSTGITILRGKGKGRFEPVETIPTLVQPDGIEAAPIDGDKDLDLVVGGFNTGQAIYVFPGGPGLSFGSPDDYPSGGTSPRWVTTGRFNGDRRTDVAVYNQDTSDVSVLLAEKGGGFAPAAVYPAQSLGGRALVSARIDKDGRPDLATVGRQSGSILLYRTKKSGKLRPFTVVKAGNIWLTCLAAGDMNGDGRTDLVAAGLPSNANSFSPPARRRGSNPDLPVKVTVLLGQGKFKFRRTQVRTIRQAGNPYDLELGRFDGDRRLDAAVSLQQYNQIAFLAGGKKGHLKKPFRAVVGDEPKGMVAGDFVSGKADGVAVADYGSDQASVLLSKTNAK